MRTLSFLVRQTLFEVLCAFRRDWEIFPTLLLSVSYYPKCRQMQFYIDYRKREGVKTCLFWKHLTFDYPEKLHYCKYFLLLYILSRRGQAVSDFSLSNCTWSASIQSPQSTLQQ